MPVLIIPAFIVVSSLYIDCNYPLKKHYMDCNYPSLFIVVSSLYIDCNYPLKSIILIAITHLCFYYTIDFPIGVMTVN